MSSAESVGGTTMLIFGEKWMATVVFCCRRRKLEDLVVGWTSFVDNECVGHGS
jgi:hypothetical protein